MQNNRWLQALIILLVIIASAWLAGWVWSFLMQFSNIILLFFLAWLLAFILRPIARWLTAQGLPYTLSVAVVYLILALLFVIGGLLLVPVITEQVGQLYNNFSQGNFNKLFDDLVKEAQARLASWGVREIDLTPLYRDLMGQIQSVGLNVLQNTFTLLQSVTTLVLQTILVLLISFYFMKDGEALFNSILQLMPPRWQDELRLVGLSIEKSFGGFVRGQLVFALVYALFTAIVMLMPPFQLDYVVIAAIVSGLCMIIPLIGNFLAFVPPMLVLLIDPNKASLWPWMLVALLIMQSLMMNVLGPRIMSSAIGIHPLYVLAAILIGGQVAGFWGALFGIPIAGAINLIGRPLMRRIRYQTTLYREPGESLPTSAFVTGPLAGEIAKSGAGTTTPVPPGASAAPATPAAPSVPAGPLPGHPPTRPYTVTMEEFEEDLVMRPSPTLSARLFRLIFMAGSHAAAWAWARAHSRTRTSVKRET
jgi:predicted PurR-regulated permease PerM